MSSGTKTLVACPRCGLRREGRARDKDKLCRDCQWVEPGWPESVSGGIAVAS